MDGYGTSCAASCGGNGSGRSARARNLMQRGLDGGAGMALGHATGVARGGMPGASHMHAAFPKSWFDHLGLVSLLDTVQRLQRTS